MNTRIYRQVSIARLSSPEQLDLILHVTTPRHWIALLGLCGLLGIAIVWAFWGSISTTVEGQGVIARTGGVLNVVTRGSGLVLDLRVNVGDMVKPNQIVARVAQPALVAKMRALRDQIAESFQQNRELQGVRNQSVKIQIEALDRQRANNDLRISALEEQAKLAAAQIPVSEQLLAKGLITKQTAIGARERLVGIQNDIDALHAQDKQLEAQAVTLRTQPTQEAADMRLRTSALERELAGMQKELDLAENVVAAYAGQVLELKVDPGGTVNAGDAILSIQPTSESLEMLAYLPSQQAKDAQPGMEVQISPAAVKREEFGFMLGEVAYVYDYPATLAALMRHFENESLVQALSHLGPVTELRVRLKPNPGTPSGYQWSTPRGAPIHISSGTICDVRIVTRRRSPITLLLPSLKYRLGLS